MIDWPTPPARCVPIPPPRWTPSAATSANGPMRRGGALLSARAPRPRAGWLPRLSLATVLLVVLGVPSAWALATGRLQAAVRALGETIGVVAPAPTPVTVAEARESTLVPSPMPTVLPVPDPSPDPSPSPSPSPSPAPSPGLNPTLTPTPIPNRAPTTPTTPNPHPSPAPAPNPRPDPSPAPTVPPPPPPPPAPAADEASLAYRAAHELHFRGADAGAAVRAWDAYLALAPDGRFAVDARYNRAIALVRAGRQAEAIRALRPFVDGEVTPAGYRQAEARELVRALTATSPGAEAP
jgi:hypothetical protein